MHYYYYYNLRIRVDSAEDEVLIFRLDDDGLLCAAKVNSL